MSALDWILIIGAGALTLIGGVLMLVTGRGGIFIAGYNTLPKEEKAKYDAVALCKFIGKCMIFWGLLIFFLFAGMKLGYEDIASTIFAIAIISSSLGVVVYTSTGGRFKKK